jgi:hypothetical protein
MVSTRRSAGHQQVLKHDVRPPLVKMFQQLFTAGGRADHLEIGKRFQVGFQTARNDAAIVQPGR